MQYIGVPSTYSCDCVGAYRLQWLHISGFEITHGAQAFEERQRVRTFKHIERYKLEARIKDFVRELIRRLHERKASRI